jgi:uncharacterized CHY-type Zn-finger protein
MLCNKCGEDKEESEFVYRNAEKKIKHGICKVCKNTLYQKRWYLKHKVEHLARTNERRRRYKKEMREFLLEFYKTHPCETCGFNIPAALEFHHKVPKEKTIEVSLLINGSYSLEYAKKEIAKCSVLCANCHRILTSKENGWFKAGL